MLFAYIDPALGSMLLQAAAGVILAAVVMGRRVLATPLRWLNTIAGAVLILAMLGRIVAAEMFNREPK
jgi:hypothetical protein